MQEDDLSETAAQATEQRPVDSVGGWGECVVNPFAFPPRLHQTRPTQAGEMARDFRLRYAQDALKLADAMLALRQQIQNPYPRRVGECFE